MSTTELTFDEALDSVTGFEEMAVRVATKKPLNAWLEQDPVYATRLLIAALATRGEGAAAFRAEMDKVMALPLREVRTYFADEPEDVIPEEPDSDAGKDDSPSESTTTT